MMGCFSDGSQERLLWAIGIEVKMWVKLSQKCKEFVILKSKVVSLTWIEEARQKVGADVRGVDLGLSTWTALSMWQNELESLMKTVFCVCYTKRGNFRFHLLPTQRPVRGTLEETRSSFIFLQQQNIKVIRDQSAKY